MVIIVALDLPDYLGFICLRARFGGKLSVARKADVIGWEDVGKRVGNVIVIKVRAAVQRRLEAVDADALLLCFAGLWRNLSSSSSSDLVSANKTKY